MHIKGFKRKKLTQDEFNVLCHIIFFSFNLASKIQVALVYNFLELKFSTNIDHN